MRAGAEYFTEPTLANPRRYEAMRAYFVQEMPAGFADLQTKIPWWGQRTLRFRLPPR